MSFGNGRAQKPNKKQNSPMKKQVTLVAMVLLIIAGTGCKKETGAARPLKKKIEGKWQVAREEVTIAGSAMVPYTGVAEDFFEFRNDENDQLDVSLRGKRTLGTYGVLATDDFNISLSGEVLNCTTNTITDNKFEFTATVNGANPKQTRKYFLTR